MTNFIKEHKNKIIGVGVALAIVVVGVVGYFGFYKPYQNKQASIAAQEQADKDAKKAEDARLAEEQAKEEELEAQKKADEREAELQAIRDKAAAKKAEEDKKAAVEKEEQDKIDAQKKAEKDKTTVSGGNVDVNKPLDENGKKDDPTTSKPEEKPKPEPKPQPEQDRTPATTQFNQVIDTSLSSGGHNHGDTITEDGLTYYWHVGVQSYLPVESWIYGRWASHPEGTRALFDTWADKGVSPFQQHGDLDANEHIERGEKFYWCSYCGMFLAWDYIENGYQKHSTQNARHLDGVKINVYYPIY